MEFCPRAIPVEHWEVKLKAITPEFELSNSTDNRTWVAGFKKVSTNSRRPDLHKFIFEDNRYKLNTSPYRPTGSYQIAGQRAERESDWYLPLFERKDPYRPLWRINHCFLPYKNWVHQTHTVLINKKKVFQKDIVQHILSFLLWRKSNVPKYFSDSYRTEGYWDNSLNNNLEPPSIPEHLPRFKYCDPVPRIARTNQPVKRYIVTVPPNGNTRRQSRESIPYPSYHFSRAAIIRHQLALPEGQYQVFAPGGPNTWKDIYLNHEFYKSIPTYRNPYKKNPDQSESYHSEHFLNNREYQN